MSFFPIVKWLPEYNFRTDFLKDVFAGITICVLLIPQGMAYGLLATLPPIQGLYTGFFAPILYCFLGTSRHVSFGLMAVVTLMTGSVVQSVANLHHTSPSDQTTNLTNDSAIFHRDEDPRYTDLKVAVATSVTLLVGVMQVALGFFRFGRVSTLMSEPLTRGFTTGAACHVFSSQLKPLLGLNLPHQSGVGNLIKTQIVIFTNIASISWASFLMGLSAIAILYVCKAYVSPGIKRKYWANMPMEIPIDMIVVLLSTIASWSLDLHGNYSVKIVGDIPAGFPMPVIPSPVYWKDMLTECFALALVSFAIGISLVKIMAKRHDYEIDSNQDLLAYGFANSALAFFACMPSSVCMSRTMLLDSLGTKSQLQGIVSSCVILVVLLAIGPLFKCLPHCVLAAIIMTAVRVMFFQVLDLPKLWRISKWDFFVWVLTFSATVFLDVAWGLIAGILFSIFSVMYRTQTPVVRSLGFVQETQTFQDMSLYEKATEIPKFKICKLESFLYYGNIEYVKDSLNREIGVKCKKSRPRTVKNKKNETFSETNSEDLALILHQDKKGMHIIFDCSAVTFADYMGVMGLSQIIKEYKDVDINVLLTNCTPELIDIIRRTELADIPESSMFLTTKLAILSCS